MTKGYLTKIKDRLVSKDNSHELERCYPTQLEPAPKVKGLSTAIKPKYIAVAGGKPRFLDPDILMRMIKRVTQQIGEYKSMDSLYADFLVPPLRKARNDMITQLESHFKIHWRLDESGQSEFYY